MDDETGLDEDVEVEVEVETTVRYSTIVTSIADAFTFVMTRIEGVGPDPQVEIVPVWGVSPGDVGLRRFEVSVSGRVSEPRQDPLDGLDEP